jgi:glycosyltransferase involved in cell wall biosynthesis
MKVLLSAYYCEPDRGSEEAVGWNWALQLAKSHDVVVFTRVSSKAAIEQSLARHPVPRLSFVYIELPIRVKGRLSFELHCHMWQVLAYRVARKMNKDVCFDVVHHVTLGRYWMPSFMQLLPAPFVWGPVGGGESAPVSFRASLSWRGKLFEVVRDVARFMGELNPFVMVTARKAAVALATTEETAARLRKLGGKRVLVHPQFGMTPEERQFFGNLRTRQEKPFRLISMGRLLPGKGFYLGLLAFAKLQKHHPDSEYWIVNDGIEMESLKELVRKHDIEGKVKFWGRAATLQDVYAKLEGCDALVHPALHEAFGCVCLEALASGRPVLCLDRGGPALQVASDTGFKARSDSPDTAVSDLAAAMMTLAGDPELCLQMGNAARHSVAKQFDWQAKSDFMTQVYMVAIQTRNGNVKTETNWHPDFSEARTVEPEKLMETMAK